MYYKIIFKYALIQAILLTLLNYLIGFTEWYKNPAMVWINFFAIPIQALTIIAALRETKTITYGFAKQFGNGVFVAALAGVFLIVPMLLYTMFLFPNYFKDIKQIEIQRLKDGKAKPKNIKEAEKILDTVLTPTSFAIQSTLSNTITGLIYSLFIAGFIKEKKLKEEAK